MAKEANILDLFLSPCFFMLISSLFLLAAQMATVADPGPIDKSVLYDQDNHVSSAVWDGQVVNFSVFVHILF